MNAEFPIVRTLLCAYDFLKTWYIRAGLKDVRLIDLQKVHQDTLPCTMTCHSFFSKSQSSERTGKNPSSHILQPFQAALHCLLAFHRMRLI
jgi:hypothetical protein